MVVRTLGVTTDLVGVGGVVCMPNTGALYALKRIVPGLLVHLVRDSWVSRVPLSLPGFGRVLPGFNTNISTIPTCTDRRANRRYRLSIGIPTLTDFVH